MVQKLSYEKFLNILFVFLKETKHGLVILDTHSDEPVIVYANNGFLKLTGYSKDEVIGKNFDFLFGTETSNERISEINALIKNKGNGKVSLLTYRKDGNKVWNLFAMSPIHNIEGETTYLLVMVNDVTEQRNFTKRQAEFDAMKATLETVNDIVFNYMNYLLEFRAEMEEHFMQEGNEKGINKLKTFDSELKNVLRRLMKMNELKEYKEKYITGDLSVLLNENMNGNNN